MCVEIKTASKLGAVGYLDGRILTEINSYLCICEFLCVLILYLNKLHLTTLNYIEAVSIGSWGTSSSIVAYARNPSFQEVSCQKGEIS